MDDTITLGHLEALADTLGIQIRYEHMEGETAFPSGGLCRVKDKRFIIIDVKATAREKIQVLARAFRRFDLNRIYLIPGLRDLLEGPAE